jgi:serpin B
VLAGAILVSTAVSDCRIQADPPDAPARAPSKSAQPSQEPKANPGEATTPAATPAQLPAVPSRTAEREAAIRTALKKTIDVDYADLPLEDAIADLCRKLDVPFWIDRVVAADEGVDLQTLVTIRVRGVAGTAILNLMISPSQLAWLIDDEVLKITTATRAADHLEPRVYDVTDLVTGRSPKGPRGYDFNSLINLITNCVAPDSWEELSGGPGSAQGFVADDARMLAVRQTQASQQKVQSLLADLHALVKRKPAPENHDVPLPSQTTPIARREAAIRRALDRPITLDVNEEPLDKVLEGLARKLDVNLVIDEHTLLDEGVPVDQVVSFKVTDISARSALKLLLEPLQLAWLVRDEVLFITTATKAGDEMEVRVYDVSDLVMFRDESGVVWTDFNRLINLLFDLIEPNSWGDISGPPPLHPFRHPQVAAIVFPQTPEIHDRIAAFLTELRNVKREAETARAGKPAEKPRIDPSSSFVTSLRLRDPRRDALARGANQFAIDLYSKLAARTPGNLVLSPDSISHAMGMAYAGARGETAREISDALHYILRQEDVVSTLGSSGISFGLGSFGSRLGRVNQIWAAEGTEFLKPYEDLIRFRFRGDLAHLDFSDRAKATEIINDWAVSRSEGSILRGVGPDDVPQGNAFIVASFVRFAGGWTTPFPREATKLASFSTGGADVDMALMHLASDSCGHAVLDDLEVLEKTYADRGYSLIVLLPPKKPGALAQIEAALSENNLGKWLGAVEQRRVEVFLPRFRVESSLNLRPQFEALGIRRAFDPRQADFSGMAQRKLALGTVLHRAFAEVDERGSRPLFEGASNETVAAEKAPENQPVFRADRPSLFIVRNNMSGSILFIGRVVRPEPVTGTTSTK